jgi:hypothetical protein
MVDAWTPERAEQLRRSVAMLAPGAPGLSRQQALEVLAALTEALRQARDGQCVH